MSILLASNKVFKNYLHGIFELVQKKYVYNWQFLLLYHLHKFIEDYMTSRKKGTISSLYSDIKK